MSKLQSVIAATAAWAAGLAAFGALIHTLAPVTPPAALPPVALAEPASDAPAAPKPVATTAPPIELDPVVIVARAPSRVARRVAPAEPATPRCSAWRGLVQGDVVQRVRVCEDDSPAKAP
ncbi:MAG TPA: hypothetical protein VHB21_22765 [Minicystis sp.]|nr:hypothetical protein [Minicystis sp.]